MPEKTWIACLRKIKASGEWSVWQKMVQYWNKSWTHKASNIWLDTKSSIWGFALTWIAKRRLKNIVEQKLVKYNQIPKKPPVFFFFYLQYMPEEMSHFTIVKLCSVALCLNYVWLRTPVIVKTDRCIHILCSMFRRWHIVIPVCLPCAWVSSVEVCASLWSMKLNPWIWKVLCSLSMLYLSDSFVMKWDGEWKTEGLM